ncbi:ornithine cyclodeaminase family protein [Actinoplanes sp. CA-015351]|uniref:ornithine cyclodeaminase family protein n=1 Tax=Actinoplanes sp. CA-015351 TaxID=3239897 RepID=UPI003D989853
MTLILNRSDVLALLRVEDVIAAVEQAHIDLAHGRAALPAPASAILGDATFVAMTAVSEPAGLAAATAVATRALARPDARVLGLIGAGPLAEAHAHALSAVHPFDAVVLWGRTPARSAELAARLQKDLGCEVRVLAGPREVTLASDVLCTLTPSKDPLVKGDWFLPGLHVNAVGAPPRPDHREIDTAGVARARVVVDSYATTMHESGEAVLAVAEGAVTGEHFRLELGEVLAGLEAGRQTPQQITLFNSVGVGLQDLATARLLIDQAVRRGLGTRVDLAA